VTSPPPRVPGRLPDPSLLRALLSRLAQQHNLTSRLFDILIELCLGRTDAEIAELFGLSRFTVATEIRLLCATLRVRGRRGAKALCISQLVEIVRAHQATSEPRP
jgi:DNA-binding NarL/FixJ family response regulator